MLKSTDSEGLWESSFSLSNSSSIWPLARLQSRNLQLAIVVVGGLVGSWALGCARCPGAGPPAHEGG
jgi:hypothetical protein